MTMHSKNVLYNLSLSHSHCAQNDSSVWMQCGNGQQSAARNEHRVVCNKKIWGGGGGGMEKKKLNFFCAQIYLRY